MIEVTEATLLIEDELVVNVVRLDELLLEEETIVLADEDVALAVIELLDLELLDDMVFADRLLDDVLVGSWLLD